MIFLKVIENLLRRHEPISMLAILLAVLAMAGCGEKKVVDVSKLIERDGLKFEINSEKPFTGRTIEYFPNGQKKYEGEYRDGKPEGKWAFWYKNGQKWTEFECRDGKPDGKSTTWYENGQKKSEGERRNGIDEGEGKGWYENGQKSFVGEMRDGTPVMGTWTQWDENGKVISNDPPDWAYAMTSPKPRR